jgi:N-acetylmuramoyl-L-alanine amidase
MQTKALIRSPSVINKIILHCSANSNPNYTASDIRHDHMVNRGFSDIGYHFFIRTNGTVEIGRPITVEGAHCQGHNWDSIGICLNGLKIEDFTPIQFESLRRLLLQLHLSVPNSMIYSHHYFNNQKSCPVYDVNMFQKYWANL